MLVLALVLGLGWGCAGLPVPGFVPAYDYFTRPEADDAWSRKIELWQDRERSQVAPDPVRTPAAVAGGEADAAPAVPSGDLRAKYGRFMAERKRGLARDLAEWIQEQAREHYVADGPIDHWATLEETFQGNGDDCDGLELLTYNLLRELGFGDDEVFRAIVYRLEDGQHHMVTLWFETGDDPWVIDPTGAMTSGMPQMSDVPGWVPLKIFTEDRDFTVRPRQLANH